MRHFGHIRPCCAEASLPPGAGRIHRRLARPACSPPPSAPRSTARPPGRGSPTTSVKQAGRGVVSMVLCLEDSIGDAEVAGRRGEPRPAVRRPRRARPAPSCRCCSSGSATPSRSPTWCGRLGPRRTAAVRIRTPEVHRGARRALPGGARRAPRPTSGRRLFAMPVLESPELLHLETRVETLAGHRPHRRQVPRPGPRPAARRHRLLLRLRPAPPPDMTAYDVQIVASVIADVVNVLGRADGTGFTVTGPVWEYFRVQERMFKPQLRRSPFLEGRAEELRDRADRARHGRPAARDRARPGQRAAGQDLHPPLPRRCPCTRCPWSATRSSATPQDILRPERGRRRRAALRVHEQDERGEAAPRLGRADPAARRGLRRRQEDIGFVDLLAAGLAAEPGTPTRRDSGRLTA